MTLSTMTFCAEASMRRLTKPGPGDVGARRCRPVGQRVGQPAGQFTRVGADLLAQLKRQVGGVVAVLGVARTLDGDRRRQRGGVEAVLGQHRGGGGLEQLGQIGGGHEGPSYGLGWSAPRIRFGSSSRCVRLSRPIGARFSCAPVAQGIERLPPEQKAAGSNPAGGTTSELPLTSQHLAINPAGGVNALAATTLVNRSHQGRPAAAEPDSRSRRGSVAPRRFVVSPDRATSNHAPE